jgi:hypothetical protein
VEVDRMALVLMAAWEQAEGTDVGVSYVATFVDLARAALGAEPTCRRCGMVVHDFHGDRVWRDADGGLTCDQLPVRVNSPFHVVVAEQAEQPGE